MKRERLVIKVINVVFVHRGLSFIISVFLYQHVMLPHDSAETHFRGLHVFVMVFPALTGQGFHFFTD